MNFIASRRNTTDGAMIPVSPSHAIIQVTDRDRTSGSNRRPRKRERSLAKFENQLTAMGRGSPRSDSGHRSPTGVEIQVTSPSGWAVTETSHGQQKIEDAQYSDHGSPGCQLRRPRTAWPDDADVLTRSNEDVDAPTTQQRGSMYVNSGYDGMSDDDDEEECSVSEMLAELQRRIENAESRLASWNDVRAAAQRDAVEERQVHAEPFHTYRKALNQLAK